MSDLANRTIKNSIYSFGGFLWVLLLSFFSLPILIRHLGAEQYGIYITINVVLGLFALMELGFSYLLNKKLSEDFYNKDVGELSDLFSVTFWFYLLVGLLAGLTVALLGSFVPSFFHLSGVTAQSSWQLSTLAGAILFLQIAVMPLSQIPAASQRFDILTKINLINLTILQLSMVLMVLFGFGIRSLLFVQMISAILLFLTYIIVWKKFAPRLLLLWNSNFKLVFIEAFKNGLPFFLCNAMFNILSQFDKYVLGIFWGPSAVSFYSSAQMLPNKIQNVSLSLSPVFFPVFSNADYLRQKEKLADIFRRGIKFIIYITSGLVTVVLLYGWELLRYWLGPEFALNASFSIRILAVCYFFLAIYSFVYYFLGGIRRPKFAFYSVTLMAAIDMTMMFVLIPRYGLNGASVAYLISVIPIIGYIFYIENNIFGEKFISIFKNYSKIATKIVFVNFLVGVVGYFWFTKFISGLWSTLLIGGITYFIFLMGYWMLGCVEKSDRELIKNYFILQFKKIII